MGCDIHPYVERKIEGQWHLVQQINYPTMGRERDYTFFCHLAGVRNYNGDDANWPEPIGLPEDVSVAVKYYSDRDGADGHSHSWTTAKDFIEKKVAILRIHSSDDKWKGSLYWQALDIIGVYIDEDYENDYEYMWDDYRVVFWFDN